MFSLYCSITMEKISSSTNDNTSSLFLLLDAILLRTISSSTQKLFSTFQSTLQSQQNCGNSKILDVKNLDSELRKPELICKRKDDGNLSRHDVKMVMGNLGIFCSPESEELPESFGSNELAGLFDEKEPSLGEVKEAFDVFDENRDGFIDARELQRVLCILGLKEGSKLEDCQKMIRTFDENRDGRIEFSEFVKFMEASLY
ncbi:PREDICTED: probable calcium-binding protein CML45 [Prunus mume]|uniref:Probable calcium-binding protein CML45 n=1 Tax=Prunus mume TaxID=102107 RepID=A0ABM0NWB5_PRUMU|nr:PREDICTED: probable calcium-binding protein CML45 [Prunus mume]